MIPRDWRRGEPRELSEFINIPTSWMAAFVSPFVVRVIE
jgi:hypothetical protein